MRRGSKAAISFSRPSSRIARSRRRRRNALNAPDVVLASNTSTLPITSLAETSLKPENFIGVGSLQICPFAQLTSSQAACLRVSCNLEF
ncbi:MAG TPA: 3-hydroxyacyl-CoA dehydrogenase NAD-binding domain-containing protein [Methylocystis sp.]|nr:3-hydroxyacyl-CoA dehydrogenase NAD-binding domain-containing protein [Methylocystis sp.]